MEGCGVKRCKVCRTPFEPRLPLQAVCGIDCARSLAISVRGKAEKQAAIKQRKADRERKEKLKTRSELAREAQQAFNTWIRLRDAGRACISCGRHHRGQMHAGHFMSVGARPELRYEPLNVWLQCAPCNTYLSGNAVLFRQALVREIGQDKVDWLEGQHPAKKYTADELRAIKAEYTAKALELKREAANV
jgi:hypothetical protein